MKPSGTSCRLTRCPASFLYTPPHVKSLVSEMRTMRLCPRDPTLPDATARAGRTSSKGTNGENCSS
eukprot:8470208-Lingulodinium_polyedra.AAC.1